MLNPKKKTEHSIYSDILTPPDDYPVLEKAVATTYSLDISALVSCMIPLSFADDVNSRIFQNKVSTLTAFRNLSDRLVIFCDPGQIKTLKSRNKEFAILLEKMITPVVLNQRSGENVYPAFHPKMWLLQFTNDKQEHFYRLIILSRNISYDKCYDVSVVLESYTQPRKRGEPKRDFSRTESILHFIEYLTTVSSLTDEQNKLIKNMISEITNEQICFKVESPFDAEDFDFYPIYENTFRKNLFDKIVLKQNGNYKKIFVMSPFISDNVLNKLSTSVVQRKSSEKKIKFITRQESIDKIKTDNLDEIDFYVLNSNVISGEESKLDDNPEAENLNSEEEELASDERLHDIHAKIFLTETAEKKQIFLGSANATESAFNRNVELMVRFSTNHNSLNVDAFFNDLNTDKKNMFVPAVINTEQKQNIELQTQAENLLRKIAHIPAKGNVEQKEDLYNVRLEFEEKPVIPDGITVNISPINNQEVKRFSSSLLFENLPIYALSEFYCISVIAKDEVNDICLERLIKIPTANIPYEKRDGLLINQIIKDKESFTEYVSLLLSRDPIATQLELKEQGETSAKWKIKDSQMPLYESLLQASVANPQAVLNLGKDIDLISDKEIVSEEFKELYDKFRQILERKE